MCSYYSIFNPEKLCPPPDTQIFRTVRCNVGFSVRADTVLWYTGSVLSTPRTARSLIITEETMETPHSILKKFFGYDSFRPGQEQIVQRLLAGQTCWL